VRSIGSRYQRTLARPVDVTGVGFIVGHAVRLRFRPAPANTGIVFVRSDRPGSPQTLAHVSEVSDTRRRTTIGSAANGVTLVEHVLATLSALRVDNCSIELNGSEPPGLDGSAHDFVRAIERAGTVMLTSRRELFTPSQPVCVARDGASLAFYPHDEPTLRISYLLDYGAIAVIPRQRVTVTISPATFSHELAAARTFLLESEVAALRAQGIGRHLRASDVVVFGERGVIANRLRWADEPARHKVLDLIGDLALTGHEWAGHIVAYRSGHALNVELAQQLAQELVKDLDAPPQAARRAA
jgi:UDP-3-O-[3-hydroxymyristoyl] N-acetylglucosamine deacetylase